MNQRYSDPDPDPASTPSAWARLTQLARKNAVERAHRSSATPLAALFALLIMYASLYPFGPWNDQGLGWFEFLQAPWPRYWSRFDISANLLGYAPLGFLITLAILRSTTWPQPVVISTAACALLSLLLETLQGFLPGRIQTLSDLLLNTAGGLAGALTALAAQRWGWMDRWSRFRERWFVRDARAAMVLLLIWPATLLFPAAVPLALGQIREEVEAAVIALLSSTPMFDPLELWLSFNLGPGVNPMRLLSPLGEALCVALGLMIPLLLAFAITPRRPDRVLLLAGGLILALGATALSSALAYGPEYAWAWLGRPVISGLAMGLVGAALCVRASRRWCLVLLLAALVWQLSMINQASSTAYYALALQSWEQGRFIRFQGLTQWLAWAWPFAALIVCVQRLVRKERIGDDTMAGQR
jgi:VanZ family protein